MKNVHFISLGCARNLVDSEYMAGLMNAEGYKIIAEPQKAELIIINTCGFIAEAKQESIDTILEAAEYKQANKGKCKHLVVTGCLAERYPGQLRESIPEVDLVMGTSAFNEITKAVSQLKNHEPIVISSERIKDFDLPRLNSSPFYSAYLKLAEGCAKQCSFCIIPKLRGPLRSRSIPSLMREALTLTQGGVRELNLIAQDLTDYGRERKDGTTLAGLLRELVKLDPLKWIRLFYTYPDDLKEEVIQLIKTEEKICKYLDVPIQHIDDEILRNMNRKTTSDDIRRVLYRLKEEIPGMVIRTSLMVGFPGETEAQFQKLIHFVEEGLLDQVGIFTYSHEEDTPSFKRFSDTFSLKEKESRRKELSRCLEKVQRKKLKNWLHKRIEVLVEGTHDETDLLLKGRHYGQAPGVDNLTFINDGYAKVGSFVNVEVTELAGMDLVGGILSAT